MKIIKISKRKNLYEVMLSDKNSLSFYDDTIIKYNLLKPREISELELKEIIEYNNKCKAYHIALKYIEAKLRTKKEVEKKLNEFDNNTIAEVIKRLEKDGLLCDDLYIKCFIADQVNLTLKGPYKIKQELVKMGFVSFKIDEYLSNYEENIWVEKVKKIINKRINSNHNASNYMLINKTKAYVINQGYPKNLVEICINNVRLNDDSNILKKEYEKELKKLSRKYDGRELASKIKYNLYKKGFSMTSIAEILDID